MKYVYRNIFCIAGQVMHERKTFRILEVPMPVLTFTLHKTVGEMYYFRLRDISDRALLTSRNYSLLSKCIEDIYGIRHYSDFIMELEYAAPEGFRFRLKAPWGVTIARSEAYEFSSRAKFDMHLIDEEIHDAEIEDRSANVRFVPVQPLKN